MENQSSLFGFVGVRARGGASRATLENRFWLLKPKSPRNLRNVSRFLLKPARILQNRLVTSKMGDPIELDWIELCRKFSPQADRTELTKLTRLSKGMFLGLSRSGRTPDKMVVFTLWTPNQIGDLGFVLKADPSFVSRVLEAYRVEEAEYDGKIKETEGSFQEAV